MALEAYFQGFENVHVEVEEDIVINTWVGGSGEEAVLLLHGHPENYLIWRDIAPTLAQKYRVVATDLRGYGDSSKPVGLEDHSNYSKRVMAQDNVSIMQKLGIQKFHVVGHDRGARVAHRLILDHPEKVLTCTLMDILPTYDMYEETNREFATKYWHWFFYIQKYPFPERALSVDPAFFIHFNLTNKVGSQAAERFPKEVLDDYIRCYADPACVHGICEDYRASASIDLEHDKVDRAKRIKTPLLVLWGADGVVGKIWNVLEGRKQYAENVSGIAVLECGHFVPEEQPQICLETMMAFFEQTRR
ncbi:alpha/beta fold hydrolase [Sulfurospirillum cavolei]|uniref:alpha/beta fold hydrolase n=1 Tax=Sulfurospirillum cavolei TaxID=366522 RepID=UPI003FA2EC55